MIKDSENQDGPNEIDAVGISWYHPETFDKCLSAFDDASSMHDTYDEWLVDAIKTEKMAQEKGLTIFRVYIDPIEFPEWCKKEGYTKIDKIARTYFCSLEAERMARERRRKKR